LIYDRKPASAKYVDIFLPINFLEHKKNIESIRVLNIIPILLVSSTLESFGIMTRIIGSRVGLDKNLFANISLVVKDYDEKTDSAFNTVMNLMASSGGVTEFIGFLKVYFAATGASKDLNGKTLKSSNLGYNFDKYVEYHTRRKSISYLTTYRNFIKESIEKGVDIQSKAVDGNFQIFGFQSLDESDVDFFGSAKKSIDKSEIVKFLPQILFEYYYYLDYIASEFSPMSQYVSTLFNRWTEDPFFKSIFEISSYKLRVKDSLRQYVTNVLIDKFSYVFSGAYNDSE